MHKAPLLAPAAPPPPRRRHRVHHRAARPRGAAPGQVGCGGEPERERRPAASGEAGGEDGGAGDGGAAPDDHGSAPRLHALPLLDLVVQHACIVSRVGGDNATTL
jgi:hypothetical protein